MLGIRITSQKLLFGTFHRFPWETSDVGFVERDGKELQGSQREGLDVLGHKQ